MSRRGKDLAAVVPIEDLRLLERLARQARDRADIKMTHRALKEARKKGTISGARVKKMLGL